MMFLPLGSSLFCSHLQEVIKAIETKRRVIAKVLVDLFMVLLFK
jgi:hypothetical protein